MRTHRGGVIQSIPSEVYPGVCCLCRRQRTLCALVVLRGNFKPCLVCSQCRIAREGEWAPQPPRPDADLKDEPRARMLGRGLRARSPSKHSMPFTF